ncbi:hypothetical protein Y032_0008g66 [Ancylostoma ceylanicum]|nr:hypothetical protein Y032_0008g66 [Ancylostoma ceylanicum]
MKLARIFVRLWPTVKALLTFITTILQLLYIINRSTVHSPFLSFAGVRLEKLTARDLESFERIPMHLQSSGVLNRLWRFLLALPGIFSRLFGYGLFFVQFVDFMYNSDIGSQFARKAFRGQVPPAPHKLLTESSVLMLDTNKCPLCMRKRTNDTALSVSGYVFCYSCIHNHVNEFKTLDADSPCSALNAYTPLVIPSLYGAFPFVVIIPGPLHFSNTPLLPFPMMTFAILAPFPTITPGYHHVAPFSSTVPRTEIRKIESTVSKETRHYSATSQSQTGFPIKKSHKILKNRKSARKSRMV